MSVLSFVSSVGAARFLPAFALAGRYCRALHRSQRGGLAIGLCEGILSRLRARPADMVGAGGAHGALHRELPHRTCRAPAAGTEEFRVTFDQDFAAVVQACAAAGAGRMDEALIASFVAAFDAGLAHSVEIWDRSGVLAGGIFGLAIGKVFFTEGHFARAREPPKSASPRSTAICSAGAICSMTANISAAAYASSAFCRSSGRPSMRCSPWPAQEPAKTDAGRSIKPLTLLPGIRGR